MVSVEVVEHKRSLRERARRSEVLTSFRIIFKDEHYLKEDDVPGLFDWRTEDYLSVPDPNNRAKMTFYFGDDHKQSLTYIRNIEATELIFPSTKNLSLDWLGPKLTTFMESRDRKNLEVPGWESARSKLRQ